MSDNSEPNPTQTEVTSSEQLVGLVPIEGEDHNIGVQLISGDTDEDFFGTQAIELNGERHVIVSQAQDPETGELLLVLRGENGEHIAIQSEALSSMVQASGGDNIQVSVETQEEAALTLASDIISLSQSVSTTESNPMTTSLTALPSIIANIPSQTQQITAPTNVVQSIDTPRVSQEEQPSSIPTVTTAIPPLPLIESDQTPEPTTIPSLPIEKTENQEIDVNKEEVTKELIDNTLPKEDNECKTHEIIPQKEEEEESKEKDGIALTVDKDTNISERVSKEEELKEEEIVEPKEAEVSPKTDETEEKTTEPKITIESVSQTLESNEIPSDKKNEELEKTIDSNVILESTPVPEVTTTDTTLTVSSAPITTSLSIPSTPSLTTSLPTTLTTTSITSETIPSVSEEKVTTNTTETVNSVPELGFGNTAVIQVQDSGNDSSLEQLMANAVLTADGNYVLMAQTEDGQVTSLPSELNLSDVISAGAAGGQTFLIETPEGLVACTAATSGEDGAIQLIPTETGDIEGAVISSAQSSGTSVENQIIQAISGGQAMSYTFNSSSGCLELTAVNPTPTPTPPQKSSRGGRGSRSNKSKTTPIPSMGQTLLLTAETDTPNVTTKPSTPSSARNKGGGGRGKGNKITNESNSSDSTLTSNTLQTKPISKTLTNETLKSSTSVKGQTPESSTPPGPSQLAASRRTYSKKSNIVWITPDASQGANSTTFATVATASVKSKPQNQTTTTNSISTVTKPTVETTPLSSRVRTPSPTKVTAITTPTQSTSPTKTTLRSSSPIKTVSVTAQDSSLTAIKPIDSKTTNKPMVTTIANKSSPQITSNDKKDTTSKTTGDTTNTTTKLITASKTVASKSSVQSSPTKGQTPDLSTQSPLTSTETAKKTTIRVSDITATKTSVETSVAKTAVKTVVTVPSATKTKTTVTKSTAPTIASTTTSTAKPTPVTTSSNKTISQSITKKSSIPTITTVSSVNKPITTTTTTSSTKVSTNIINSSDNKSSKIPQSVTTVSNESNVSITTKQSKTSDSVKSVSNPIAVKSHVSSELSSTKSATNSSEKLNKKVSEKPVSNRNVETRHSARLSPTKSLKTDSNPKEIDSNPKVTQSSTDLKESKVESPKIFTEKEVSKSKPELENESKTKSRVNDIESSSTQKTQKTEETLKSEIQTHLESNESIEEKSIRKSRRSSRNISIVEEIKKEVKPIEENKTIETKTKDTKEIKDKNIKEKIKEIPVESITTRRTSRKREVTNEDKPEETPIDSLAVVQTTVVSTPTPSIEAKSQRQTRASSCKKPDVKQTPIEENLSKTVDTKLKETEIKVESKTESDFDRIIKETKPPEKAPEKSEPVLTKPNETTTSTRSVKKKVQFEIKEKGDEEEDNYKEKDVSKEKVSKNLESTEKTPEMSASVSTRRSLRSSTPQTPVNPIKNDVQSNQKEVLENNTEKSEKQNIETNNNNKTPQRFSTRKRKEVTKSLEIEVKEVVKSPKKPKKSENDIESDVSYKKTVESSESPSNARLRDRKSKGFKPKSIMKETVVRHSIETSDPFSRINRKQSLIQSFIDENEWQEKEDNLRRKTISSLSDLRSPNECYDYSTNECSFYIRHQSASLTPKQSTGNYLCQKCGFHTTRINNLVIHHRDQCSYVKNAVIQHWQTELQKRVRPSDTSLTASTSTPETKRRKTEINDELNNNLDKNTDLSDDESEDEEIATNNGKTNQNPTISDIDAMLMGSDDEDLLSIDNIEKPKREFGFSEDDIVWVETNSTHWPALVSKVFPKEKKALIRLIDSPWPKKSLKADISSISLFDSAEVNKQYLREGRKGVNGDVLVKAVQKAEEFLRKKCLGNELNAVKFFDQIDSDLSEANADEDERLTPNKDIVSTDLAKETAKTSNDSTQDSSLVNDGSNGDDTEDDKMPESNEAIAKWKEKRRQQNAKLLQCIKDGKVETHLVGVYRESITSERHQKFKSGSDAEKNQLKHVPWFGPIDDEEQQEEIYDYCSQLFKSNFKTDGSFDTVAYIFEVWVPEAIVKAISRVRRIELKESESIFAKGVILSQTEKDEMNKEIQKEAEKHMTSQTSSD